MRLIDADALKASIEEKDRYNLGGTNRIIVCGMLDDAPTIDAEPVKHARWVKTGRTNGYGDTEYKCLNCQSVIYVPDDCMIVGEKHCFNCGCKMALKDGENNV